MTRRLPALLLLGIAAIVLVPAPSIAADVPAKADTPARLDAPAGPGYGTDVSDVLANAAVEANPNVLAIEDRIGALEQKVAQARVWLDPTFSAEYSNMPINDPVPGEHPSTTGPCSAFGPR
jgi:outer membrane protein TolC